MKNKSEESRFVIIYRFYSLTDVAVVRWRLEAESIEFWMLDELTAQVNPAYTAAIGGIRLQIRECDIMKVTTILEELGFDCDKGKRQSSKTEIKLCQATSKIPLLKKMQFELRLMTIVAAICCIITTIIYFITLPSTFDRLTKRDWCLEYVIYDGITYTPNTISLIKISGAGFCPERISMRTNGIITMPGFDSYAVIGEWALDGKSIEISKTDSFEFLYDGMYEIEFVGNELILKSEHTTIYCRQQ